MSEIEGAREAAEQFFLEKKAKETVDAWALDEFLTQNGDFDEHMEMIAGYLDEVVVPELNRQITDRHGIVVADKSAFYEKFRQALLNELGKKDLGKVDVTSLSKEQTTCLIRFILEIRDFEFNIP